MLGTPMANHQSSPLVRPTQPFCGIRFVLLGFDPVKKSQVSRKLVSGGAVDAGQYGPNCTHVIVDKLVYDDPPCVAARRDGKILVNSLWVDHSFDVGAPVETTSVMYTPVRDLNGIPGAKSILVCLTGYQREDREDIMTMVELMGAKFSKPLIAHKVTHLICYKFEGEKYLLAKRVKKVHLINHQWLEDCLKAWEILPEADYSKSGYELEMEAEARDSEDEPEGVTTRHNEGIIASPHHSLLSKQEIPKTISNASASKLFSDAQETVSVTINTRSDPFLNSNETEIKHRDTGNITSVTSEPFNYYGKPVSSSSAQDNVIPVFMSANKSPHNEAKTVISASYSMKDPVRTPSPQIDMKGNNSSSKRANKVNINNAFNMSSSLVQKATPYNSPAFCPEDKQNNMSCGSFKLQQMSHNSDVESVFQELKKDPPIEASPAHNPPANLSGRKPFNSKGKSVISDLPISKPSISEIEDMDSVQRPQKEYKEGSLSAKSNNRDVGMAENMMQSPSAVSSDLQKSSTLNSEINEQSAGSNPKPVRKKSISKKLSAPKLSKKNTVNQKGSIFLKNTDPGIENENLFKYQQLEKVSSVPKLSTEIETGFTSGMQFKNMSENRSLCMDDETEPPDETDEANKEKHEDGEPETTVDVLMEEKAEGNVDVVDPSTDKYNDENDLLSKRCKQNTAPSMKEVTDKKSVKKNKPMIDINSGKQEIREEATPIRAKRAQRTVKDLEESMEVNRAGVCIEPEQNKTEKVDYVDADMDIENVVNKETVKNKRSLSKAKNDVSKRNGTGLEKSVEVKRAGVCDDPEHNDDEKGDDVDADMDIENVVKQKVTKRSKRSLSKTKKDASTRDETDLEKSVEVKRAEGVCNGTENNNDEKSDDVDADMDIENAVNKETKRNKRAQGKTMKDVSKRNATDLEKLVDVERAEGVHKDQHTDAEKGNDGADMDTENVTNKKETKRNKRPLSRTKKDDAKAVNKKGKPTPNQAVKMCDLEEAQKENVQIHVHQNTADKHVFKAAKEFPEKNTVKANSKDEPMWFILTGHQLQRREFQQIIRRLKGRVCKVAHKWSYQATHFIVPDPIKRTEKFFAAAASGRWILKTDYLSASNQVGKFLPEETYEWHKNGLSEDGQINLEAPRKWRLLKEKTGHGAFYGMKIIIYGECIAPPLDTLKRAVKAGDGTILATSPPYTRFLDTGIDFAVVSPGMPHVDIWVQEFLRHEIPCVSADYLVEYVCKPGYSLEKHVQYGTNVWAERSYNNLKKRLEEEISEPRTPDSNDVACEVCGARDRGEEMLICGDENGSSGCGVGTHIDCCDPPLEGVPEEDWFCSNCKKLKNGENKKGSKKKGSAASRGK